MRTEYSKGYVIKDRKYWRAVVSWQGPDGRQKRLTESTGVKCYPDKKDPDTGKALRKDTRGKGAAEDWLRTWRDRLIREAKLNADVVNCRTTVYDYSLDFIRMKEVSGSVTNVTTDGYRCYQKHLLGTELGGTPMCEVTPRMVQDWEGSLLDNGLHTNTVSHIHVFLKMVFTRARKIGDLPSNPFDLVEAPKRRRRPANSLTREGVSAVNEALGDDHGDPFVVCVKLALMTGMREGEICGLRWQDVDLTERVIHVTHSLTRANGKYLLSSPKSESSSRSIPIGMSLASALAERCGKMQRDRREFGLEWDEGLYVAGNAVTGANMSPMVLGKDWRSLARALRLKGTQGERPCFHDLRHTFATLAIASGMDVKTASVILGHADAQVTLNVYADALADTKRSSMDMMDEVLTTGRTPRQQAARTARSASEAGEPPRLRLLG